MEDSRTKENHFCFEICAWCLGSTMESARLYRWQNPVGASRWYEGPSGGRLWRSAQVRDRYLKRGARTCAAARSGGAMKNKWARGPSIANPLRGGPIHNLNHFTNNCLMITFILASIYSDVRGAGPLPPCLHHCARVWEMKRRHGWWEGDVGYIINMGVLAM